MHSLGYASTVLQADGESTMREMMTPPRRSWPHTYNGVAKVTLPQILGLQRSNQQRVRRSSGRRDQRRLRIYRNRPDITCGSCRWKRSRNQQFVHLPRVTSSERYSPSLASGHDRAEQRVFVWPISTIAMHGFNRWVHTELRSAAKFIDVTKSYRCFCCLHPRGDRPILLWFGKLLV